MLAYCLIGNHYHFVLYTRQANLSLLMRHINGVYTQTFDRRHRKVGHLFQGVSKRSWSIAMPRRLGAQGASLERWAVPADLSGR